MLKNRIIKMWNVFDKLDFKILATIIGKKETRIILDIVKKKFQIIPKFVFVFYFYMFHSFFSVSNYFFLLDIGNELNSGEAEEEIEIFNIENTEKYKGKCFLGR